MAKRWNPDDILELARQYQAGCVLGAAADLEVFTALADRPQSAGELARGLACDARAMTALLDALAALRLLKKNDGRYANVAGVTEALTRGGGKSVLAMVQHQANCLRRWVQLAEVVKTGRPARCTNSIRGAQADQASFIEAMNDISSTVADRVIAEVRQLEFDHLLDVGGASGTWTIAFLRAHPEARSTLFDLPHVIPMAKERVAAAGLAQRVKLVAGDFMADPLPDGSDLAWVSAIVHQNSRDQNRRLFSSVHKALEPGGRILIRDILMDECRTAPVPGALFAINMLVATQAGGTFTPSELEADLRSAGFTDAAVLRRDPTMNCILTATKPG